MSDCRGTGVACSASLGLVAQAAAAGVATLAWSGGATAQVGAVPAPAGGAPAYGVGAPAYGGGGEGCGARAFAQVLARVVVAADDGSATRGRSGADAQAGQPGTGAKDAAVRAEAAAVSAVQAEAAVVPVVRAEALTARGARGHEASSEAEQEAAPAAGGDGAEEEDRRPEGPAAAGEAAVRTAAAPAAWEAVRAVPDQAGQAAEALPRHGGLTHEGRALRIQLEGARMPDAPVPAAGAPAAGGREGPEGAGDGAAAQPQAVPAGAPAAARGGAEAASAGLEPAPTARFGGTVRFGGTARSGVAARSRGATDAAPQEGAGRVPGFAMTAAAGAGVDAAQGDGLRGQDGRAAAAAAGEAAAGGEATAASPAAPAPEQVPPSTAVPPAGEAEAGMAGGATAREFAGAAAGDPGPGSDASAVGLGAGGEDRAEARGGAAAEEMAEGAAHGPAVPGAVAETQGWSHAGGEAGAAARSGGDPLPAGGEDVMQRLMDRLVEEAHARPAPGGGTHVEMKLVPEHLGRVHLELVWRDDALSAHFFVENAEARAALEQHLPRLEEALREQGIAVAALGVEVGHSGRGDRRFAGDGEQQAGAGPVRGLGERARAYRGGAARGAAAYAVSAGAGLDLLA